MTLEGQRIGSIRIEERLGAGGMGEVYRGFDEKLEREVALKTMPRTAHADAELKGRFLREARLLSKLGHPGICRIHDLVETDAGDFLVLELVDGSTLRERSLVGLARAQIVSIGAELATALAAAHGAHVIHRDLKPENVMLTRAGAVKILDFGIGRAAGETLAAPAPATPPVVRVPVATAATSDDTTEELRPNATRRITPSGATPDGYRTEHGTVLGTRRYMSPEQAAGDDVGTATDIFALGTMLEELLAHATDYVPTEDTRQRDADPDLAALLGAMTSWEPQRRPDAAHVADALRSIADKPRRVARRRLLRRLTVLGAIALVVVAAAMAWLAWTATRARADAERRRGQAETLVDFMLGDLRRKLEGVGRLELLEDINARALRYFDAIPAGDLTDRELDSRVRHLHMMADVAVQSGDVDAAEAPVSKALALAEEMVRRSPRKAAWQQQHAEALNWVGMVRWEQGRPAREVLDPFRAGLAITERLARAKPADDDRARTLAASYNNVGAAELSVGTAAAAIDLLDKAVATRRAYGPRAAPERRALDSAELAASLGWLSSAQETGGRLADALVARREQVALLEALAAAEPDNTVWQADLSVAYRFQSDLEFATGADAARETTLRRGLDVAERLAAHDPDNAGWRRSHAVFRAVLASHLLATGRAAEARAPLNEAIATLDALLAKDAENAEWLRHRALAALRLALLDTIEGRPDRATGARELATIERLAGEAGERTALAFVEPALLHARALRLAGDEAAAQALLARADASLAPWLGATRDWQALGAGLRLALARGDATAAAPLRERLVALGARAPDAAALCAQPGHCPAAPLQ